MKVLLPLLLALLAAPEGPSPFRCDNMAMDTKSKTLTCNGNAMLGQGTILLCCDALVANFTSDKNNKWELASAQCRGRVRSYIWTAQKNNPQEYFVWGDSGDFNYQENLLVISGQPLLRQGPMEFTGNKAKIYLYSKEEQGQQKGQQELSNVKRVVMEQPQGVLAQNDKKFTAPKFSVFRRLPARCPLPLRQADSQAADAVSDE